MYIETKEDTLITKVRKHEGPKPKCSISKQAAKYRQELSVNQTNNEEKPANERARKTKQEAKAKAQQALKNMGRKTYAWAIPS